MKEEQALKQFVTGGAAVFIAITIGYALTFFYKLIIARSFGSADYGLYEMLLTILSISIVIAGTGLYSALQRFIPYYVTKKKFGYVRGLRQAVTRIQTIASLIVAVLIFLLAPLITNFFGFRELFTSMLQVGALAIPLYTFTKSNESLFFAYKKSLIAKSGNQIIRLIVVLGGVILLYILQVSIYYIAWVLLISYAATVAYYMFYLKKIPLPTQQAKYEVNRWFRYAGPLLLAGIVGFLLSWTDNFVIAFFLTETELGIYAIAFSVAFYLFFVPKLFSPIFLPVLTEYYEKEKKQFKELYYRIRSWSILFASFIGLVFVFFSKEILTILFGAEYAPGAAAVSILSIFFIATAYVYFAGEILLLNEKTTALLYADIAAVSINLIASIWLVQQIGITGAAISTGASFLLVRVALYYLSKKQIRTNWYTKEDILNVLLIFLGMITSYALVSTINTVFTIPTIVYVLMAAALYATLTITLLIGLKRYTKQDLLVLEVIQQQTKLPLTKTITWLNNRL
ncbi:MAG: flippase [Candidatus Woesearchaeota archaeon]